MDVRTNLEMGCPGLADTCNSRVERAGTVRNAPSLQTCTPTVLILRKEPSEKGGHGA